MGIFYAFYLCVGWWWNKKMNAEDIRFFDVVAVLSRHIDEMHIKVGKIGSLVTQYRGLPSNKLDIKACISGRHLGSYGISGSNEQGYRIRFIDRPLALSKMSILPQSYTPRSPGSSDSLHDTAGALSSSGSAISNAKPRDEDPLFSSSTSDSFSGLSQSKVLTSSETLNLANGVGLKNTLPPPFMFTPLPAAKPLCMKISTKEYARVVFTSLGTICFTGENIKLVLLANPCLHSVLSEDFSGIWKCVKCSTLFGLAPPLGEEF